MYNYAKTIDDLPEDVKLSFIKTKEIRIKAAGETVSYTHLTLPTILLV